MSEQDERPRILVAGDGAVPTGFARVMEGIFTPLAAAYEIHQLATNYRGDPHGYGWQLYPAETGGDRWGAGRVLPLIEKIKPRLVFILNDIWVQHAYLQELRKMRRVPLGEDRGALGRPLPGGAGGADARLVRVDGERD